MITVLATYMWLRPYYKNYKVCLNMLQPKPAVKTAQTI